MTANSSVLPSGVRGHWCFPAARARRTDWNSRQRLEPEHRRNRGRSFVASCLSLGMSATSMWLGKFIWKSAEYSMREAIAMMLEYQVDMLLPALFTLQASEREAGNSIRMLRLLFEASLPILKVRPKLIFSIGRRIPR